MPRWLVLLRLLFQLLHLSHLMTIASCHLNSLTSFCTSFLVRVTSEYARSPYLYCWFVNYVDSSISIHFANSVSNQFHLALLCNTFYVRSTALHFFVFGFRSVILFYRISSWEPCRIISSNDTSLHLMLGDLILLFVHNVVSACISAQLLVSYVLHAFMPFWFQPMSSLQSVKDDGLRSRDEQAEMLDDMGSQRCCVQLAFTHIILHRGLFDVTVGNFRFVFAVPSQRQIFPGFWAVIEFDRTGFLEQALGQLI